MMSKVKDLLEICNEKTAHNHCKLFYWSLVDDFKKLQDISFFNEINDDELKQFIKICDNRLDKAKTYLNEVALVLGFTITSLSIVLTFAIIEDKLLFSLSDLIIKLIVSYLFVVMLFQYAQLAHYRSQVQAWTAFKEKAIMEIKDIKTH